MEGFRDNRVGTFSNNNGDGNDDDANTEETGDITQFGLFLLYYILMGPFYTYYTL